MNKRREPANAGDSAAARFTGSTVVFIVILGLAPQALCLRLLRRLKELLCRRVHRISHYLRAPAR